MIQKEDYILLKQHPALALFSIEDFEKIASEVKLRKISKGQILFFEDDRRDRFFLLKKGYIKLEQYDETANYSYIHYIGDKDFFPLGGIFYEEYYRYTATAVGEVEYFSLPVDLYEEYSRKDKQQLLYILKEISKNLELHELRLRNNNLAGARERVFQALSILCYQFCQENTLLPFPLTSIDLSKLAATSRESVYQAIKEFKKQGLIEYQGKRLIYLKKEDFLRTYKKDQ